MFQTPVKIRFFAFSGAALLAVLLLAASSAEAVIQPPGPDCRPRRPGHPEDPNQYTVIEPDGSMHCEDVPECAPPENAHGLITQTMVYIDGRLRCVSIPSCAEGMGLYYDGESYSCVPLN